MKYEKTLRIPVDRIGALIGKSGRSKKRIEDSCGVKITVNSRTGEISIENNSDISSMLPFRAVEVVTAIGRGFSADKAMLLLDESKRLHIMDIREFAGKSGQALERIRGRVIGEDGRARRNIEQLGRSHISVYGKTVSIIGDEKKIRVVISAINSIMGGGMHAAAYSKLEAANRREKSDRMLLWEGQQIGI